jgi:2-O-methyltransferase
MGREANNSHKPRASALGSLAAWLQNYFTVLKPYRVPKSTPKVGHLVSDESQFAFFLRAQSELLEASLSEIPEQARNQRKAITQPLAQMFFDFVSRLLLRAQSELLEASLSEIPEQARSQRKAITQCLAQMFFDLVSRLLLRAQSELLEASLSEIPEQARNQRKAITQCLAQMFFDLVSRLNAPLVLEIGAHEGGFSAKIKASQPGSRVIALEAHPLVYARYAPAMKEAGVEYLQLCVAEREGDMILRVPKKDGVETPYMGSLLRHRRLAEWVEYPVSAVTLDGFLGDAAGVSNAMWIDVEGALAQVFSGAERTLRNCQAVYVEMERAPRWEGQLTDVEVVSHLALYGLRPVLRDIQRHGFYNAIFVR